MGRTTTAVLDGSDDEDGFSLITETLAATVDTLSAKGPFVVTLCSWISLLAQKESCHCGLDMCLTLTLLTRQELQPLYFPGTPTIVIE